jgi:hypothetical protein
MSSTNSSYNHGYTPDLELVKRAEENHLGPGARTRNYRKLSGDPVEENIDLPPRRLTKPKPLPVLDELTETESNASTDVLQTGSVTSTEQEWDAQFDEPRFCSSRLFSSNFDTRSDKTFNQSLGSGGFTGFVNNPNGSSDVGVVEDLDSELENSEDDVFGPEQEDPLVESEVEEEVDPSPFETPIGSDASEQSVKSTLTVIMGTEQDLRAAKSSINMVEYAVDDDLRPVRIDKVTSEFLEEKCEQAEEEKKRLRKAVLYLRDYEEALFATTYKDRCTDLSSFLSEFVIKTQERIAELARVEREEPRNVSEAAAAAARAIKVSSVQSYQPEVCAAMKTLEESFKNLVMNPGLDQAEFKKEEDMEKALSKRFETIKADALKLKSDAVDAGLPTEAAALEKGIRELQKEQLSQSLAVIQERRSRNLTSTSSSASVFRGSDITPPTFSGDGSGSDFFKFKKDLDQYTSVKNPSNEELVRVILTKCLKGEAHTACEHLETKEEIIKYLRDTYGNVRVLLNQQLVEVKKLGNCTGGEAKMRTWCLAVKAKLTYVLALATDHGLETELYHSRIANEIQSRLPHKLLDDFLTDLEGKDEGKELPRDRVFKELMTFISTLIKRFTYRLNLGTEIFEGEGTPSRADRPAKPPDKVSQGKPVAKQRSYAVQEKPSRRSRETGGRQSKVSQGTVKWGDPNCPYCSQPKHDYVYYCTKFQESNTDDRFNQTKDIGVCFRCLMANPETVYDNRRAWWRDHDKVCKKDWICTHEKCGEKPDNRRMCFLLCKFHAKENAELEKNFIKSLDKKRIKTNLRFFFIVPMLINWCFNAGPALPMEGWDILPDICQPAIFMMSYILVEGNRLLVFFDSGCMTAAISQDVADLLTTECAREGPSDISVASGQTITIPGGEERFSLPLSDGRTRCTITALVMPEVTSEFPVWELEEAYEDLDHEYQGWCPGGADLPRIPKRIGGRRVDIMLGIRYYQWFPQFRYQMRDGLSLHESQFICPEDESGILAGPHKSWKHIGETTHLLNRIYNVRPSVLPRIEHVPEHVLEEDAVELHGDVVDQVGHWVSHERSQREICEYIHCTLHQEAVWEVPKHWEINSVFSKDKVNRFMQGEEMGTSVDYRCPACRNCTTCKSGERLEMISLVEEREQFLIEKSLRYDKKSKKVIAKLPFIANPLEKLKPNEHIAKRVFQTQLNKASNDESVRLGIVASFKKLYDKGYVCKISDLPENARHVVDGMVGYTIPWRTVVKESSLSTPVRMVFDASSRTPGGESLNDVLAKGSNTLGNLLSILLRFRLKRSAFSADVSMAYNGISMDIEHIAYQKFYWREDMKECNPLLLYVVLTLIYGIRSAGNQTIAGFGLLSELARRLVLDHPHMFTRPLCYDRSADLLPRVAPLAKLGVSRLKQDADTAGSKQVLFSRQDEGDELPPTSGLAAGLCYDRSADLLPRVAPLAKLGVSRLKQDADTGLLLGSENLERGEGKSPEQMYVSSYDRSADLLPRVATLAKLGVGRLKQDADTNISFGSVPDACQYLESNPESLCVETPAEDSGCVFSSTDLEDFSRGFTSTDLEDFSPEAHPADSLEFPRPVSKEFHPDTLDGGIYLNSQPPEQSVGEDIPPQDLRVGAEVLEKTAYMDDIASSHDTDEECREAARQLEHVLALGSMKVKDLTFSGQPPSDKVSSDGVHVGLLGLQWNTLEDIIMINVNDLYLGKKKRGKTPTLIQNDLKERLQEQFTRRVIVGKTSGVYDPLGLLVPFTARYKLHLSELSVYKLDWDDSIPEKYLDRWVSNIEEMQTLGKYYFSRSVIPADAANLDLSYIVSCDASQEICICTVHSRVLKRDGTYHVQILTAKSKIVTKLTIPRAEMKGAVIASALAFNVKQDTGDRLGQVIYVTDSSIVLYWLKQDQRPLQTGVRNAVLEVRRLTELESWYHVSSADNVADIGTRSDIPVDVGLDSEWTSGKPWMSWKFDEMPLRSVEQITLNSEQKKQAALEMKAKDIQGVILHSLVDKVGQRHSFSKYIYDPTRRPWPKSVRTMSIVLCFLSKMMGLIGRKLKTQIWHPKVDPEDPETENHDSPRNLQKAANYYFIKATAEVKQFTKKSEWKNCQTKGDGILYYSSRVLEGQEVPNHLGEGLDVDPLMFMNPLCDRYSPVSYSIMMYSHSIRARHRNVAETVRESRQIAFVVGGRDLAIEIRENCPFCRRFRASLLKRSMGKLHENRFVIAPAFFNCQVDIFGPLTAICEHNHRSTVKVWGLVFKCPTTGAVSVHCMQKYDTSAFVMAYTRFSSRFGHPQKLVIDAGSQLKKAVKDMEISLIDAQNILSVQHQVGTRFEVVPVGAHYQNGQVERGIKEVKSLFEQIYSGFKLDILSHETAFQWISNELNCFPQCLGSHTSNLDNLDIITPARLLHGRNNRRCLSGQVRIDMKSRLMQQVDDTTRAWFAVWKNQRIQTYVPQPQKWHESGGTVNSGDVVIMLRKQADMAVGEPVWKIGRVVEVTVGRDGLERSLKVEYRNATEKTFRETIVPARSVAILHHEQELELVDQLNVASQAVNHAYTLHNLKVNK